MDEINWEEYNPKEIKLPDTSIPKDLFRELVEFLQNAMEKESELMSLTTDVLDRLYREIGGEEETATLVISYLQRRHKWDMELLAERRDVDDILFREHNLFDEYMWDKVMNAQAISDLHHEVYKLSQTYIARAIREVLRKDGAEEQPPF
jgi:hypothetical protein